MIPILGYVISIAVAIVMFVLSLGFYCGFIRAIQTMIDIYFRIYKRNQYISYHNFRVF